MELAGGEWSGVVTVTMGGDDGERERVDGGVVECRGGDKGYFSKFLSCTCA